MKKTWNWINDHAPAIGVVFTILAGGAWVFTHFYGGDRDELPSAGADQPKEVIASNITCYPKIFGIGGSSRQLNEIGLIDTISSSVLTGGSFNFRIVFRDDVDIKKLSCLSVHFCRPDNINSCSTIESKFEPVNGKINSFVYRLGERYEPGQYRLYVKLIQVNDPRELLPDEDGTFGLSDYQRYHTMKDFEVKDINFSK